MARGPDKGWLGRDSGGRLVEVNGGIPAAPSPQSKADGLWSFASAPSVRAAAVTQATSKPTSYRQIGCALYRCALVARRDVPILLGAGCNRRCCGGALILIIRLPVWPAREKAISIRTVANHSRHLRHKTLHLKQSATLPDLREVVIPLHAQPSVGGAADCLLKP